MTTMELNAQIFRDLAYIAEDERLMKRAAKYLGNLVAKAKAATHDDTLMTKEEYFAKIERSKQQIERGECTTFSNKEAMMSWLNSL